MKKTMKWALMFTMTLCAISLSACSDSDDDSNGNGNGNTENPDPLPPDPVEEVTKGTVEEALAAADGTKFGIDEAMVVATDGHTVLVKGNTGYISADSKEVVAPGFKVSLVGEIETEYGFKTLNDATVVVTGRDNAFTQPAPAVYDATVLESWLSAPKIDYGTFMGTLIDGTDGGYMISVSPVLTLSIPHPAADLFKNFKAGSNVQISAYTYGLKETVGSEILLLPVEIKEPVLNFSIDIDKKEVAILPEGGKDRIVITIDGSEEVPVVSYNGTDFTVTYDGTPNKNEKLQGIFYIVDVSAEKNPSEEQRTGKIYISIGGQNYYVDLIQHGAVNGEKAFVYFANYFGSMKTTTPFVEGQAYKFFGEDLDINVNFTFGDGTYIKEVLYNTCWFQHPVTTYQYYILFVGGDTMTFSSDKYSFRQIEFFGKLDTEVVMDGGNIRFVEDVSYTIGTESKLADAVIWTGNSSSVSMTATKNYTNAMTGIRVTYVEKK